MGKTRQTIAIVPTRLARRMALGVGLGGGEVGVGIRVGGGEGRVQLQN